MSTPTGSPRVQKKAHRVIHTLEVKSYADEEHYTIVLSGHVDTVKGALDMIPFKQGNLTEQLEAAMSGYMPEKKLDDGDSSIRRFANHYVRVMLVDRRSRSDVADVFSREQAADILINAGWEMIGFATQQTSTLSSVGLVERWIKKDYTQ